MKSVAVGGFTSGGLTASDWITLMEASRNAFLVNRSPTVNVFPPACSGILTSRSIRLPGDKTNLSRLKNFVTGLPSTAITVADSPSMCGEKMRALAPLINRRRIRSPGFAVYSGRNLPFIVGTLPQRPSCMRSRLVMKWG